MFLKSVKCPSCAYRLPKCSPVYQLKLPPREITCKHCGVSAPTSFIYRTNWLTVIFFRLATVGFYAYFIQSQLVTADSIIFPAIAGFFGSMFFGWVTAGVVGGVAAPVLQAQLDLLAGIGKLSGQARAGSSKKAEAERLQAFVTSNKDSSGDSRDQA